MSDFIFQETRTVHSGLMNSTFLKSQWLLLNSHACMHACTGCCGSQTFVVLKLFTVAGHDCSIRLWNLDGKTCVQEITSHRKKCDEAIHDVAFHPSKPYIASAGADALAKVFV